MKDHLRRQAKQMIDDTDALKMRLKELARRTRATDVSHYYENAEGELEWAIAALQRIVKREENE